VEIELNNLDMEKIINNAHEVLSYYGIDWSQYDNGHIYIKRNRAWVYWDHKINNVRIELPNIQWNNEIHIITHDPAELHRNGKHIALADRIFEDKNATKKIKMQQNK